MQRLIWESDVLENVDTVWHIDEDELPASGKARFQTPISPSHADFMDEDWGSDEVAASDVTDDAMYGS